MIREIIREEVSTSKNASIDISGGETKRSVDIYTINDAEDKIRKFFNLFDYISGIDEIYDIQNVEILLQTLIYCLSKYDDSICASEKSLECCFNKILKKYFDSCCEYANKDIENKLKVKKLIDFSVVLNNIRDICEDTDVKKLKDLYAELIKNSKYDYFKIISEISFDEQCFEKKRDVNWRERDNDIQEKEIMSKNPDSIHVMQNKNKVTFKEIELLYIINNEKKLNIDIVECIATFVVEVTSSCFFRGDDVAANLFVEKIKDYMTDKDNNNKDIYLNNIIKNDILQKSLVLERSKVDSSVYDLSQSRLKSLELLTKGEVYTIDTLARVYLGLVYLKRSDVNCKLTNYIHEKILGNIKDDKWHKELLHRTLRNESDQFAYFDMVSDERKISILQHENITQINKYFKCRPEYFSSKKAVEEFVKVKVKQDFLYEMTWTLLKIHEEDENIVATLIDNFIQKTEEPIVEFRSKLVEEFSKYLTTNENLSRVFKTILKTTK